MNLEQKLSEKKELQLKARHELDYWANHEDPGAYIAFRTNIAKDLNKYVEGFEHALRTIAKGCPTGAKGCTCLENTAQIALGEGMGFNDHAD